MATLIERPKQLIINEYIELDRVQRIYYENRLKQLPDDITKILFKWAVRMTDDYRNDLPNNLLEVCLPAEQRILLYHFKVHIEWYDNCKLLKAAAEYGWLEMLDHIYPIRKWYEIEYNALIDGILKGGHIELFHLID